MSLKERLKQDLLKAMKAKDSFKRDVIRFLNSSIKQIEVDERRELSDDEIIKIIQKSVKQREDAIKQFEEAGREDLIEKEKNELEILSSYLPKQLSDEELESIVKEVIDEVGAKSMADIGKVMGVAIKKTQGKADGKRINEIVKKVLG
jgi:uncharacterized protein YqeY